MDGRWEEDLRFVWGGEFFLFFCFLDIYTYTYILFGEEEEKPS